MSKLITAPGFMFLFCVVWSLGNGQAARRGTGGSAWKGSPNVAHSSYVLGFTDGYLKGMKHGAAVAVTEVYTRYPDKLPPMPPSDKKEVDEAVAEMGKFGHPLIYEKSADLEAAVSTFYDDYRNMPVCWDRALLLAATSLGGNGATDKELEAARKAGAEGGCR